MHVTLLLTVFLVATFPSVPVHSCLKTLASSDLAARSGDENGKDLSIRLCEAVIHGNITVVARNTL